MQQTSEPLFSELNRLRKVFSPLRDRLAEAGKQFHDSAVPLPENLVSDLADFKNSVAELGNRVQGVAKDLSLSQDLPVADLDEIGRSLQVIAAAEPVFKEKPQPTEVDVRASVEEAIRLANLCREQGKNSEADRIYQRLLEVPRNTPAAQPPRKTETLQEFAAAKAESIRPVPAQQASVPSGAVTVTAVEGDINQEIDAILENISQLAAKTAASAATAPPVHEGYSSPRTQSPPEFALAAYAPAEPVSSHPHPLRAHPMFMSPESSRPAVSRPMIFGGVALAGALAVAILAYMTMRQPTAPAASPMAAMATAPPAGQLAPMAAPITPEPIPQPQEQAQPLAAAEPAGIAKAPISQTPATSNPVAQPTALAPVQAMMAQSGPAPQQTAAMQSVAAPPVQVPVQVKAKPVQEPQGTSGPNNVPKPLVAKNEVPEPPRLVTGLSGPPVGSALSGLVNPVASIPPPSPPPQEPLRIGGQLQAAKLIHITLPEYPAQYRQAHIQGTVRMEAVISKEGTVQKLTVISGNKFLNGSAIAAVKQWRYQPTLLNGEPVAVVTTVDVNFAPNE